LTWCERPVAALRDSSGQGIGSHRPGRGKPVAARQFPRPRPAL